MQVYSESSIIPYDTWKHVKTSSLYTVLGIALCSTNGKREHKERSVVYISHERQALRYRKVSEFLDGRFIPLPK